MSGMGAAPRIVAIDGGRSGVRVAAVRDGRPEVLATGPGLPVLAAPGGPGRVAEAIEALLPLDAPLAALVGGLTGIGEAAARIPALLEAVRERSGANLVALTSDVVTSHLGALAGRAGVVAAAGTGSVTLALRRDGAAAKVDGWGYLLGDRGSGYDIGRRGLLAAMEHHDGRAEHDSLYAAACARFGDLDRLAATLYGSDNPARDLASFTPDVVELARRGDAEAASILDGAVTALATAIVAAADRVGLRGDERIWSWAGSILGIEDLVRVPLQGRLAACADPLRAVEPRGDAIAGAARLLEPDIRAWLGPLVHTMDAHG
jgi:glucosamine kinase